MFHPRYLSLQNAVVTDASFDRSSTSSTAVPLPLNLSPSTREEWPLFRCESRNNLGTSPLPAGRRERRSRCEGASKQPVVREAPAPPQQRGRRCDRTRRPSLHLDLGIGWSKSLVKRSVKLRFSELGKWSELRLGFGISQGRKFVFECLAWEMAQSHILDLSIGKDSSHQHLGPRTQPSMEWVSPSSLTRRV